MEVTVMRGMIAVVLLMCGLAAAPARAGEVRVAVTADFAVALERIVPLFQKESGHTVTIKAAASGKLFEQIRKGGAPFDVFLSADEEMPRRLMQEGLAVGGSRFVYAGGVLVLWSVQPGYVDEAGAVLNRGGFEHLAIANPVHSPYGVATRETLTKLTMWNAMQRKLDKHDDVAQAWRAAASERAELAFVALSQVMRNGKVAEGSWWRVPPEMYRPIRQSAVLLTGAQHPEAATAFLSFLKSEKAHAVVRGFGYEKP